VTCLLCIALEVPDWVNKVVIQAFPGHFFIVLIGVVVGYIRDLNLRLRSELAMRKQMETQLNASQERFRAIAESTPDAVVSADSANRIISWNRGAEKIFGYTADEIIGKSAETLLPQRYRPEEHVRFEEFTTTIARDFTGKTFEAAGLRKSGDEFFLEQSLSTWQVAGERFFTSVIRDISERKRIQKEREDLIAKLQQALADIKTLSGLVPICASCKRIRDDKGFWNQLESYISKHSQAQFSHGICPECSRRLYPELYDEETADGSPGDPPTTA
jgi:PAS domain S-box-containing protein